MKIFWILLIISGALGMSSCKNFMDVVPDDVATLDNAFATRIEAMKYLFTCYSYIQHNGDLTDDPAMAGGDETWDFQTKGAYFNLAKGLQKVVSPYGDRWTKLFRAIRDCNIFLANIERVHDMEEWEKYRWIGEVKFLKAYYNFYLVKMYGPIPLMKTEVPVNASQEDVRVLRQPVDSCFDYIVQLLNEAVPNLPEAIDDPANEMGRITQPIALAFKAKVLVYAASPLFNGNTDEAGLKNPDGTQLFNQTVSQVKWDSAAKACKEAIDAAEAAGFQLYYYLPAFQQYDLSDTIMTQLSIRNAICERWNSGIIWANTQTVSNSTHLQTILTTPWDPDYLNLSTIVGELSPPLKIAELFYTDNGVPIEEDKTWGYNKRYTLQTSGDSDKLYIRKGWVSAHLNFDREPRYYADMGFDGSIYYGQSHYDDKDYMNLFYLDGKYTERNGFGKANHNTVTGYYIKKLIHYQNVITTSYSATTYPFPIIRLAGLYLLYAEALNESQGPSDDVYKYLDLVRARAGLKSVEYSWTNYSNNPSKYTTQKGLRDIIRQERLIELAFEGQRFWDLRRWKEAATELNKPIMSWDLMQNDPAAYYRPVTVYNQVFKTRDYLWPISEAALEDNANLVQNPGW